MHWSGGDAPTPAPLFLLVPSSILGALLLMQCLSAGCSIGCGRQVVKEQHHHHQQQQQEQFQSPRQPKVVGGNDTHEGEFPWIVSIRRHGNHHCGGVIVGQRWILTAAHCVHSVKRDLGSATDTDTAPPAGLVIRAGEHDLARHEAASRDYAVDRIFVHHNYRRVGAHPKDFARQIDNADIALLKTTDDIRLNEYAWPVCIPKPGDVADRSISGREAVVIGWGKRAEKSDIFSERLQKVALTIVDAQQCAEWFRVAGREFAITDRVLCAGYRTGGRDACHGDSGGPLLLKQTTNNGIDFYIVAGIVSTGIGCARPYMPGIYSNVSSYLVWINRTILQFN